TFSPIIDRDGARCFGSACYFIPAGDLVGVSTNPMGEGRPSKHVCTTTLPMALVTCFDGYCGLAGLEASSSETSTRAGQLQRSASRGPRRSTAIPCCAWLPVSNIWTTDERRRSSVLARGVLLSRGEKTQKPPDFGGL